MLFLFVSSTSLRSSVVPAVKVNTPRLVERCDAVEWIFSPGPTQAWPQLGNGSLQMPAIRNSHLELLSVEMCFELDGQHLYHVCHTSLATYCKATLIWVIVAF